MTERAKAAWSDMSAGLLRGLTHALGNALHPLEMMSGAFLPGETVDEPARKVFDDSLRACGELVALYRHGPVARDGRQEACRVEDALREAIRLFSYHVDATDARCALDIEGDAGAVLAYPLGFTQAVVTLLVGAVQSGATEVAVAATSDEDRVRIETAWAPSAEVADDNARAMCERFIPHASLAVSHAGTVTRAIITVPTLAASRRRTRG
jgi:hypothetical protein